MSSWTRRAFVGSSLIALAGCNASRFAASRGEIDTRVSNALGTLYSTVPGARNVADQAHGMLVMPEVGEASLIYGAGYGEGALLIGGATVDYYSAATASFGLQVGAQRSSHVLMFMTPEALADFRTADGWELGADAEYTLPDNRAGAATVSTSTFNKPIYAVVFNQQGLNVGAAIDGTKYSRIIR